MDRRDFDKFMAHLARQPKWAGNPQCPICGIRNWDAQGPTAARTLEWEQAEAAGLRLPPESSTVFAMVLLVCKRCYYVHQFVWRPIEEGRHG